MVADSIEHSEFLNLLKDRSEVHIKVLHSLSFTFSLSKSVPCISLIQSVSFYGDSQNPFQSLLILSLLSLNQKLAANMCRMSQYKQSQEDSQSAALSVSTMHDNLCLAHISP